jgi:hypothetical protein
MELWLWTLDYLQNTKDPDGGKLYNGPRQGVTFPMADALCWLLASRHQVLDVLELEAKGPEVPTLAEGLPGLLRFLMDLCHIQAGRAAGEVGRICAELVFGYRRHPAWDDGAHEAGAGARISKAGPCATAKGLEEFVQLRAKLDGCLTGVRLAKDRAAAALAQVMIPEAMDYPV